MKKVIGKILILSACLLSGTHSQASTEATQMLKSGMFESVGKHEVRGNVEIHHVNGATVLSFDETFLTSSGPKLEVVLKDSKGMSPMQRLALLKSFEGSQDYVISDSVAMHLDKYDQVIIYCSEFSVVFGVADIH